VGGVIDPEDTGDREERAECEKMHALIKQHKLQARACVRASACACVFGGGWEAGLEARHCRCTGVVGMGRAARPAP
jgi:hypothetical protein